MADRCTLTTGKEGALRGFSQQRPPYIQRGKPCSPPHPQESMLPVGGRAQQRWGWRKHSDRGQEMVAPYWGPGALLEGAW